MARFLLLDGYNLAFRAYYGMPELTRSDGFPTSVVHGWLRTLWMLEDLQDPDVVLAFFDLGASTAREALQSDYKANRGKTPEALELQIPYVKQLTEALGIPVIELRGVEADDLMAAAAVHLANRGDEALLVSADKDLGQILRPGIRQILPPPTANPRLGWRELDEAKLEEKYEVRAEQIPDYLALIGDNSDNIPGLAGCGPKTAVKWLKEYGTLEAILANANYLKPPRFQEKVAAEAENLRRNLQIVTLDLKQDLAILEEEPREPDVYAAEEILLELEMKKAASDTRNRYLAGE